VWHDKYPSLPKGLKCQAWAKILQPFTSNGDVFKWVKNSETGYKTLNNQSIFFVSDISGNTDEYVFTINGGWINYEKAREKDEEGLYKINKEGVWILIPPQWNFGGIHWCNGFLAVKVLSFHLESWFHTYELPKGQTWSLLFLEQGQRSSALDDEIKKGFGVFKCYLFYQESPYYTYELSMERRWFLSICQRSRILDNEIAKMVSEVYPWDEDDLFWFWGAAHCTLI
jgi:hypothetical protein